MLGQARGTAAVDGAFVPARTQGIVAVDAGGEAVLVDEMGDFLHLLNASAALLWECFDGEATVDDIAFDLADVVAIPKEQALADTVAAVESLVEQSLVYDGRGEAPIVTQRELPAQSDNVPHRPRVLEEPPNG